MTLLVPGMLNLGSLYDEKTKSLPENIYAFLGRSESTRVITAAMALGQASEDLRGCINMAALQVFTGDIPPRELTSIIAKWAPMNEKRAFRIAQHIVENLINHQRDYLVKKFGSAYFASASNLATRRPRDTSPKLDGNIVNLKDV